MSGLADLLQLQSGQASACTVLHDLRGDGVQSSVGVLPLSAVGRVDAKLLQQPGRLTGSTTAAGPFSGA